jgi:hypothetical protein
MFRPVISMSNSFPDCVTTPLKTFRQGAARLMVVGHRRSLTSLRAFGLASQRINSFRQAAVRQASHHAKVDHAEAWQNIN